MKESFENNLREAAAIYRKEGVEVRDYDSNTLKGYIALIEEAADWERTSDDTQFEVLYNLQIEKQTIMDQLHEHLKLCDNDEVLQVADESIPLAINEEGALLFETNDGQMKEVSEGVLMTDIAWGQVYDLPAATPRALKKRYAVEYAKSQLRTLLDKQIIVNETASQGVDSGKKQAYYAVEVGESSGKRELQSGIMAEKMAQGLLTQLSIDGELPYEIEWADIYEDVEHKADFFIHKKKHSRSVTVEETGSLPDDPADFAVQFTINDSVEAQAYKKRQLKRLEMMDGVFDTVLVTYSNINVQLAYSKWEKAGRPPGGPTAFLERHTKRKLFQELLKQMFTEEELIEMWGKSSRGL